MRFSILRTPAPNMPLQRVGKAEDLDSAIATALTVRTDFQTQAVQVWENWPPRGLEKLRFSAKCGELGGEVIPDVDERCEACHDTGYYGDNGPGVRGNNEYVSCEQCDPQARAIRVLKRSRKPSCDFGHELTKGVA